MRTSVYGQLSRATTFSDGKVSPDACEVYGPDGARSSELQQVANGTQSRCFVGLRALFEALRGPLSADEHGRLASALLQVAHGENGLYNYFDEDEAMFEQMVDKIAKALLHQKIHASISPDGSVTDNDVPRDHGHMQLALVKRPGRAAKLQANIHHDAVLKDEDLLLDIVYRCSPVIIKVLDLFNTGLQLCNLVGLPIFIVAEPFAIIAYTGSGEALMGQIPWPDAWGTFCLAAHIWFCVTSSLSIMYEICFLVHPGMLQILLRRQGMKILVLLGTSIVYVIVELSILPSVAHALWLWFFKVIFLADLCLQDCFSITMHLRASPQAVQKWLGAGGKPSKGSKECMMMGNALFACSYSIVLDVFRHLLVLWFSEDTELVTLGMINPYSKEQVSYRKKQIASSIYWMSIVFMAQMMRDFVVKGGMTETSFLITNFSITLDSNGKALGAAQRSSASEQSSNDVSTTSLDEISKFA